MHLYRPQYPEEEMDEENIVEDDSELTLNEIEKSLAVGVSPDNFANISDIKRKDDWVCEDHVFVINSFITMRHLNEFVKHY